MRAIKLWVMGLCLLFSLAFTAACGVSRSGQAVGGTPAAGLVLEGMIRDRIGGRGVGGVELYLRSGRGAEQLVATSDADGTFRSGILPIDFGSDVEVRAVGDGQSFYPGVVKARMELAGDVWQLEFSQAWPVSMWARVAERVYVDRVGGDVVMAGFGQRPPMGGGMGMPDVPFYYSIDDGSKTLLGRTDSQGELFPDPVWLPVGGVAVMWPEMDGYRFAPAQCSWEHGPPLESIGVLFIAEPLDKPAQSLNVPCEQVP